MAVGRLLERGIFGSVAMMRVVAAAVVAAVVFAAVAVGTQHVRPLPLRETAKALETEEMATTKNRWQSVDGNWNTGASWTLGHKPTAAEEAVLDGLSTASVTSGLDQSAAPAPLEIIVTPDFRPINGVGGNIATSGDPLHIDTGKITMRGLGAAYINPLSGGSTTVIVDSGNQVDALTVGGLGTGVRGQIASIAVKDGKCVVIGDVDVAGDVFMEGELATLVFNAKLTTESDPDYFVVTAGHVINNRPTVTGKSVIVVGGRMDQIGELHTETRVFEFQPGRFFYKPGAAVTSLPILYVGGVHDLSETDIDHSWTSTVIGVNGEVKGGAIRSVGFFPASLDLREEYP